MKDSLEKIVNEESVISKAYNKSKKFFAKAFTFTSLLALPLVGTVSGCDDGKDSAKSNTVRHSSLPSDVQQLTLDELGFNDPIWCGAFVNKDAIRQLSEGEYKSFSTDGLIAETVDAYLYSDERWAMFLASFDYLKRDEDDNFSFGGKINDLTTKNLLSISDPLSSFTKKDKRRIRVNVAKRKLESITKVEHFNRGEFKLPIVGKLDREVYTFVVNYTINPLIPEVPKLNKKFIGRGTVTKNINTDKWNVEWRILGDYNSKLFDKGMKEFNPFVDDVIEEIKKIEAELKQKIERRKLEEIIGHQKHLVAKDLTFKMYGDEAVLEFQLDGGKPPFKYDITLNGKSLDDIIANHISVKESFGVPKIENTKEYLYWKKMITEKVENNYASGSRKIIISTNEDWSFAWSPGTTFPMQLKVNITDSFSPSHKATLETVISEGKNQFVAPLPDKVNGKYTRDGLYKWIEINGKPYTIFNLEGEWTGEYEYQKVFGEVKWAKFDLKLKQDGYKLKGTFKEENESKETPKILTGSIEGEIKGRWLELTKHYHNVKANPVKYYGHVEDKDLALGWWRMEDSIRGGRWKFVK